MFSKEKVKSEALTLMAWGDEDATMRALLNIEDSRRKGDVENEKNWALILDRIRQYEYPIDDDWA